MNDVFLVCIDLYADDSLVLRIRTLSSFLLIPTCITARTFLDRWRGKNRDSSSYESPTYPPQYQEAYSSPLNQNEPSIYSNYQYYTNYPYGYSTYATLSYQGGWNCAYPYHNSQSAQPCYQGPYTSSSSNYACYYYPEYCIENPNAAQKNREPEPTGGSESTDGAPRYETNPDPSAQSDAEDQKGKSRKRMRRNSV